MKYDTEHFAYPAYVTILGHDHCYEYALLLEDYQIVYVFSQFVQVEDIKFAKEYLTKGYTKLGEKDGESIYIFYKKDGTGVCVYGE